MNNDASAMASTTSHYKVINQTVEPPAVSRFSISEVEEEENNIVPISYKRRRYIAPISPSQMQEREYGEYVVEYADDIIEDKKEEDDDDGNEGDAEDENEDDDDAIEDVVVVV